MSKYSLTHLSDQTIDKGMPVVAARESGATATFVAWLGEFDERRRYVPAGYSTMTAYCRGELGLHKQAALKRLRVAGAARQYPLLFEALADRRLELTAALLLVPSLNDATVEELVAAAAHKTNVEIEQMLKARSQPELVAATPIVPTTEVSVRTLPATETAPISVLIPEPPTTPVAPQRPQRIRMPISISMEAYEDLRWAQIEDGVALTEVDEIFERALRSWVKRRKRQKYGLTHRPRRPSASAPKNPRTISAEVRSAVHDRDRGRCTFISDAGRRCESCARLEFDHIVPVGKGGESTVENLRLRCRAHNQYAAEETYGVEFMRRKREETNERRARLERKSDPDRDVTPWLRSLGVRPTDAKRAEAHVASMTSATLEERVKAALAFVAPPHKKIAAG